MVGGEDPFENFAVLVFKVVKLYVLKDRLIFIQES